MLKIWFNNAIRSCASTILLVLMVFGCMPQLQVFMALELSILESFIPLTAPKPNMLAHFSQDSTNMLQHALYPLGTLFRHAPNFLPGPEKYREHGNGIPRKAYIWHFILQFNSNYKKEDVCKTRPQYLQNWQSYTGFQKLANFCQF